MGDLVCDPLTATIARSSNSARRTSHVDMETPQTFQVDIEGAARDLVTGGDGVGIVAGEATIAIGTDVGYKLIRASVSPGQSIIDRLNGRVVGPGFRSALADAMDDSVSTRHPAYLLMDELPVAALISGYISLYLRSTGGRGKNNGGPKEDICAGWISSGEMIQSIRVTGAIPTPMGPPAPPLESASDPIGWHAMPALKVGAMRRRRLIDVCGSRVFAMFRDTFIAPDTGVETILHEYEINAEYDFAAQKFTACKATPHVLPWAECPGAVASAGRIVGKSATELRDYVRKEFNGTSTCTHLNDLLRSLADVETLGSLINQ